MNDVYSFTSENPYTAFGIRDSIKNFAPKGKIATVICIGSDLVLGDSLGPLVGTMLKKMNVPCYVYGTLSTPVTAKEIVYAKNYVKKTHPENFLIAVDAAVGDKNDVGLIKIENGGLRPGLGVDKKLGRIGDISVIGVVAPKSAQNYDLFNLTRLGFVYKMAENIAKGISVYLSETNPFAERGNLAG